VDECKPLMTGLPYSVFNSAWDRYGGAAYFNSPPPPPPLPPPPLPPPPFATPSEFGYSAAHYLRYTSGRGRHSSTSQLHLSRF